MITIFEVAGCPYCKRVREWILENLLDIPVTFIAVPIGFALAFLLVKRQLEAVQKVEERK